MKKRRNILNTVYLIVFIDYFCVSLIIPLLPYVASNINMSQTTYGLLGSLYGFLQMISSPLSGFVSDNIGRRAVFKMSMVGCLMSYGILGFVTSPWMFVLSRIPVGLLKHTFGVSQSYISDVTEPNERTKAMGLLNVTVSLSFIVGPAVAGYLMGAGYSMKIPSMISIVLFLLNFGIIHECLPETLKKQKKQKKHNHGVFEGFIKLKQYKHTILLYLLSNWIHILFSSGLGLVVKFKYKLTLKQFGCLMSYNGLLTVVSQGIVLPMMMKKITETRLISYASFISVIVLPLLAASTNAITFVFLLFPLQLSKGLITACMSSLLTKNVEINHLGKVLGITGASTGFLRMITPALIGILMEKYGPSSPLFFTCFVFALFSSLHSFVCWENGKIKTR